MDQKGWGRVESISFCPCMLDLLSPLDSGADIHSSKSDTQTLGLELRFSSWVPVLGLWPRTEQHNGCAGSPAYYWQMVGFLGPNNLMSQFSHISPQESLCIHAVCCVCENDPDGHTHPSEGFTELLSVFLLSCFPVNTQELAHLDFPCNLLPVKLAPARQPCLLPVATGPLLTQHGYTRPLYCQMSYSKHRNVIHLPWQIPRPSLLSSSKLDSQMHCSPSHARREAMMGLFLPRTMARVWFGFF